MVASADSVPSATPHAARVRITEVFVSLQGESRTMGFPTAFIRLTGCPLRCVYCDTEYAFTGGQWMSVADLCAQVAGFRVDYVTVTGGEPLAQKGALTLLQELANDGYSVSLETSGAMDLGGVDSRVMKVMDLKTPGSGEVDRNRYENIDHLGSNDEVKFVICDRDDYDWARSVVERFQLSSRCGVLLSPASGVMSPRELADWIVSDRLPVRFQIQLHKYLWGEERGR